MTFFMFDARAHPPAEPQSDRAPAWPARHAFLCQQTQAVVETHMAWLFFSQHLVRKLKKPVRYPFLDFSTPAARCAMSQEELRLNRRLAHNVYLGLDVLAWTGTRLVLMPESQTSPEHRILDWLVRMRRLPQSHMLNTLIALRGVTPAAIDRLAVVLTHFYRTCSICPYTPHALWMQREHEQAITHTVLTAHPWGLQGLSCALQSFNQAWPRIRPHVLARASQGKMRDGHGDLRPQHICLQQHPSVIDALEFNPLLRAIDPFDELAGLDLECSLLGAPWIGPRLIEHLTHSLADTQGAALVPWYRRSRALLKARLAIAHLLEAPPRDPARWLTLAQYFVNQSNP